MKPRVHGRGNNPARGKNVRVELIFFRLENVWVRYIFMGGFRSQGSFCLDCAK